MKDATEIMSLLESLASSWLESSLLVEGFVKGPGRWGLFSVEGFVAGLEHKVLESPSIPSFLGRESRNLLPLKVSYVVQILKKSVRIFLPRGMCFVLSHHESLSREKIEAFRRGSFRQENTNTGEPCLGARPYLSY